MFQEKYDDRNYEQHKTPSRGHQDDVTWYCALIGAVRSNRTPWQSTLAVSTIVGTILPLRSLVVLGVAVL